MCTERHSVGHSPRGDRKLPSLRSLPSSSSCLLACKRNPARTGRAGRKRTSEREGSRNRLLNSYPPAHCSVVPGPQPPLRRPPPRRFIPVCSGGVVCPFFPILRREHVLRPRCRNASPGPNDHPRAAAATQPHPGRTLGWLYPSAIPHFQPLLSTGSSL